jgi:hypothetical protein
MKYRIIAAVVATIVALGAAYVMSSPTAGEVSQPGPATQSQDGFKGFRIQ